tara:strand:+ start:15410 stop:15661 length:252 start_codon:yes stop_codon:yes gene_type:complete
MPWTIFIESGDALFHDNIYMVMVMVMDLHDFHGITTSIDLIIPWTKMPSNGAFIFLYGGSKVDKCDFAPYLSWSRIFLPQPKS